MEGCSVSLLLPLGGVAPGVGDALFYQRLQSFDSRCRVPRRVGFLVAIRTSFCHRRDRRIQVVDTVLGLGESEPTLCPFLARLSRGEDVKELELEVVVVVVKHVKHSNHLHRRRTSVDELDGEELGR